jgi:hypothetical protein
VQPQVGLDNAGKTTLLYRLSLGEVVQSAPTVGSNVEMVGDPCVYALSATLDALTCGIAAGQALLADRIYMKKEQSP